MEGTLQKQVSDIVWKNHKQSMQYSLNTAIFPYLVQEELISDRVVEKYSDLKCLDYQKKDLLISSIPNSGNDDYLARFIKCLRSSSTDDGGMRAHEELAKSMEEEFNELMERVVLSESYRRTTLYDPEMGAVVRTESFLSTITSVDLHRGPKLKNTCTHEHNVRRQQRNRVLKTFCKYCIGPAMLWIIVGCIVVLILHFEYPPIGASHPANIECGQDSIINVDLGVDPFWLESASFKIDDKRASSYTRGTVYIVKSSCSSTSTIVTWNDTLSDYPKYLVAGSSINITNQQDKPINVWVISQAHQSPTSSRQCEDLEKQTCNYHPNASLWCQQVSPGKTISHEVMKSDYYAFCAKGWPLSKLHKSEATYSLKTVSYNIATVKKQNPFSKVIDSASYTTVLIPRHDFDFQTKEYCVLLDLFSCDGLANHPLLIKRRRKTDFLLFPILAILIIYILHIIISTVVIKRCCLLKAHAKRNNSKREKSLSLMNK